MKPRRPSTPVRYLALAVGLLLATPAIGQEAPSEAGPARTVWLFTALCFDHIPDIATIAGLAAEQAFEPIGGAELEAYQPEVTADELYAWRFQDSGLSFVLSATRATPDASFKDEVPDFADSTSYACSLTNPTPAPAADLLAAMVEMMGRAPDESWDQPPMRMHSWSGQTEDLLVFVQFYGALSGSSGGLLSASTFVRN